MLYDILKKRYQNHFVWGLETSIVWGWTGIYHSDTCFFKENNIEYFRS